MKIFGDLHWLNGGASNAFLYDLGADGWMLVDAGMGRRIDPLAYLATLGVPAAALRQIVITHADVDHVGRLAALQRATGAQIYAGAQTADLLAIGRFPSHNARLVDRVSALLFKVEPLARECITVVPDGGTLPFMNGLESIATPGHTGDHMAFHSVATGILFAGDALNAFNGKLAASGRMISADYALARQSALRLAERTPAIFACGHGRPFLHSYDDLSALLTALRSTE